jgi:hypothetical protein
VCIGRSIVKSLGQFLLNIFKISEGLYPIYFLRDNVNCYGYGFYVLDEWNQSRLIIFRKVNPNLIKLIEKIRQKLRESTEERKVRA